MRISIFIPAIFCLCIAACKQEKHDVFTPEITDSELKLCDSLRIDESVLKELKTKSQSNISRLYYSLGKAYGPDGKEAISPTGYLNGIMVHSKNAASESLVNELSAEFRKNGYSIFVVENNFGLNGKDDNIAVVKDTSFANIIKLIGTDGANYNITNDSVIAVINSFAARFNTQLLGVSGDWISLKVSGGVSDWNALAEEVAKIAPDVVSQGSGSNSELAKEMEASKIIYLWWD